MLCYESTHSSTDLATCFCSWQAMKAYFLDMVWPFWHCFEHTLTHGSSFDSTQFVCKAGIHCVQGFDVIDIRFQLFDCESSFGLAALTDFWLLMQPTPTYSLPLSSVLTLPLVQLYLLSPSPHVFAPPSPSSSSSSSCVWGTGVFSAACLSNSLILDYCRMITATIPSWSLLHSTWQCSTLYDRIKMLYLI